MTRRPHPAAGGRAARAGRHSRISGAGNCFCARQKCHRACGKTYKRRGSAFREAILSPNPLPQRNYLRPAARGSRKRRFQSGDRDLSFRD
jgi:hypothetical protein